LKQATSALHTFPVLTAEQRIEFSELGFVRLHNVFTDDDAARMRRVVWHELERRYGAVEDDRSTWKVQTPSGMTTSKKHHAFEPIGGPCLQEAVDALLGEENWGMPPHWGQVMVTFPDEGTPWRLPGNLWHIDFPYTNEPTPLFGLKIFAFFGDVEPQGGGTLVISGSHRVVERFVATTPAEARTDYRTCRLRFMKLDRWFQALAQTEDPDPDRNARFMESDHDADGVPVRVVALTGRPGDVVIAHPWTLHHSAPNVASYPRMMRGKTLNRAGAAPADD
jgi:Phytanoyl-CoA dioxygenase (PhyH)